MRTFSSILLWTLILWSPLRAQEEAPEETPAAESNGDSSAPALRAARAQQHARQQTFRAGGSRVAAPVSGFTPGQDGDGSRAVDAGSTAPSEDSALTPADASAPPSLAQNSNAPAPGGSFGGSSISGNTRGLSAGGGGGGGGGGGRQGLIGGGGGGRRGLTAGGGPGAGGALSSGGAASGAGTAALGANGVARGRPSYKTLGQLAGVNRVGRRALSADGEGAVGANGLAWDGGKAHNVGVNGPGGGGDGGGGNPQSTQWTPPAQPNPDSGPIAGDAPEALPEPVGVNVTAWQGLLDKAQMLLKRAGQLLTASSLSVFIGKQLVKTGWGGAFGAGLIAAGTAMAATAAALAGAATVLGSIILLKYKQKLQGAVLTVSALALTISAVKAAQGNMRAYNEYNTAKERAIAATAQKVAGGFSLSSIFMNREGLAAIRTGANIFIGDTKAGSYMNAAFGLYDGFSGLAKGGGALSGIKAGLGLAQTWQGLAPTKGKTGEILRTALTGTQIAMDMWPKGKPKDAPPKAEEKPAPGQETVKLDANGKPILESRPIGDGMGTLAPNVTPANADLLAQAHEANFKQAQIESQIRTDAADFAAKNNITDPKAIESLVQSSLQSRADYDAAHPGAPEPKAVVTTSEGNARIKTDSPEYLAAVKQGQIESQIRTEAANFAAKNNITDPKAIESLVQSSLQSRADYDAAHPGAPDPKAVVTTSEGNTRIKTDSPEYIAAVRAQTPGAPPLEPAGAGSSGGPLRNTAANSLPPGLVDPVTGRLNPLPPDPNYGIDPKAYTGPRIGPAPPPLGPHPEARIGPAPAPVGAHPEATIGPDPHPASIEPAKTGLNLGLVRITPESQVFTQDNMEMYEHRAAQNDAAAASNMQKASENWQNGNYVSAAGRGVLTGINSFVAGIDHIGAAMTNPESGFKTTAKMVFPPAAIPLGIQEIVTHPRVYTGYTDVALGVLSAVPIVGSFRSVGTAANAHHAVTVVHVAETAAEKALEIDHFRHIATPHK